MDLFVVRVNRIRSNIRTDQRHPIPFTIMVSNVSEAIRRWTVPPQSHSTPKAAHHTQIRPGSAVSMTKEQRLTWGRLPPSAGYRSASAMGQSARPLSRQSQSDTGFAHCVGSRYPSYCTLPRPEEVDVGTLSDMHSNLHAFYANMPPKVISRAPSITNVVPATGPGIAAAFMRSASVFADPTVPVTAPVPQKQREIVNWNTLSLLCSMQVLCSLTIFGIGVGRMLEGAKWGIGVELAYALVVLAVGLGGICAARQRSYVAATFAYTFNTFCMLLAIPPFMIGLFPAIPWAFAEATPSVWSSKREPLELDFGLSLIILLQVLLSMVLSISGCQAVGAVCAIIEDIRLSHNCQSPFHDVNMPQKITRGW
ncbi:hypothetical protein KIN20_014401 [Parelaphostrongylus tenuis]|uniref:Uncharacterized protein n=1 Tax=Parelaphostrongylus tenuis TaxID=148309 RepID=A0AAD5MXA6_PARTN|nr:hypothetical protein KIN20_014401 [Parelaphostrongylus tenuis]